MSRRGLLAFAMLVLAVAGRAWADEATQIVRDADRYRRPGDSFVWKITITNHEAKKEPTTDGFEVFVKGVARTFVKFIAPPRNVGRSLLGLDRDLWIYLPDAGKPSRMATLRASTTPATTTRRSRVRRPSTGSPATCSSCRRRRRTSRTRRSSTG